MNRSSAYRDVFALDALKCMPQRLPAPIPARLDPWREAFCRSDNPDQLRELGLALCDHHLGLGINWRLRLVIAVMDRAKVFGVERLVIFEARNPMRGGIFGGRWVVRVLHRWAPSGQHDPANYDRMLLGKNYVQVVKQSADSAGRLWVPDDISSRALAGIYQAERVCQSIIVGLGEHDGSFYYLSCARYRGEFNLPDRYGVEALATAARGVFLTEL